MTPGLIERLEAAGEGSRKPAAGEWAIWNDAASYFGDPRYETAEILKVTAKTVTTRSVWGRGENRRLLADLMWSGPEAEAKALVERLKSSVGQMTDDVRRSRERHANRVAAILKARATQEQTHG